MIVALAGVSFLIAFTERKQGGAVCNTIVIKLDNQEENHFMDEAEVLKLVETSGMSIKWFSSWLSSSITMELQTAPPCFRSVKAIRNETPINATITFISLRMFNLHFMRTCDSIVHE